MTEALYIGNLLAGIGAIVFFSAISYYFVTVAQRQAQINSRENSYDLVESAAVDKLSTKLGINVHEYLAKNKVVESKSFREALEDKMVQELIEGKRK